MSNVENILKDLQHNTINFTINLLSDQKKQVTFRPIKTKDQKILTIEKAENEDVENFDLKNFTSIIKLLDSLVIKNDVPLGLLEIPDFVWLLINVRAKSIGEILELVGSCHKCKSKIDLNIDVLKDNVKTYKKQDIKSTVKLSDKIVLSLGFLTVEDLLNVMYYKDKERDVITLASLIKKAEYDGEIVDLDLDSKIQITNELTKDKMDLINKFADESEYGVKILKKYKCSNCGNDGEYKFNSYEIINFF